MLLNKITSPTLLLNEKIAIRNLEQMMARSKRHGLHFRPHFKTPQSKAIGRLYRERGLNAITVSSVHMAEYFAADGWDDITIAFPANVREAQAINRLAEKIKLNLLVVNVETVHKLATLLKYKTGIFIKIDVGTKRTGINSNDTAAIAEVIASIKQFSNLNFQGFLAHAGHSYSARSKKEILSVHNNSIKTLHTLKQKFIAQYPELIISTGDTPTCSVAENWEGIDEIRPGNFIFYDLMQVQIGACKMEDIAVAMACPVVAKNDIRNEIIVHGGGIHLSKDRIDWENINGETKTIYGLPVLLNNSGWEMPPPDCYVKSLSQEHGIIHCNKSFYKNIAIGDLLGILPVHSCMPVNLAKEIISTEGKIMDVI